MVQGAAARYGRARTRPPGMVQQAVRPNHPSFSWVGECQPDPLSLLGSAHSSSTTTAPLSLSSRRCCRSGNQPAGKCDPAAWQRAMGWCAAEHDGWLRSGDDGGLGGERLRTTAGAQRTSRSMLIRLSKQCGVPNFHGRLQNLKLANSKFETSKRGYVLLEFFFFFVLIASVNH